MKSQGASASGNTTQPQPQGAQHRSTTQGAQLKEHDSRSTTQGAQLKEHNSRSTTQGAQLKEHNSGSTTQGAQLKEHDSRSTPQPQGAGSTTQGNTGNSLGVSHNLMRYHDCQIRNERRHSGESTRACKRSKTPKGESLSKVGLAEAGEPALGHLIPGRTVT